MGLLPTAPALQAPSYTKENQADRMRELAPMVVLTCAQGHVEGWGPLKRGPHSSLRVLVWLQGCLAAGLKLPSHRLLLRVPSVALPSKEPEIDSLLIKKICTLLFS